MRAEFLYDLWSARTTNGGFMLEGSACAGAHHRRAEPRSGLRRLPLTFRDCYFDQPLVLSLTRLVTLRMPGCRLPGITVRQLEIRGNLELNDGFHAEGEVRLLGAHIMLSS